MREDEIEFDAEVLSLEKYVHDLKADHTKVNELEQKAVRLKAQMQAEWPSWESASSGQAHWEPWESMKARGHGSDVSRESAPENELSKFLKHEGLEAFEETFLEEGSDIQSLKTSPKEDKDFVGFRGGHMCKLRIALQAFDA